YSSSLIICLFLLNLFFLQMERSLDEWNLNSPSRIRPESGKTVGDDLCGPIPKDVRPPGLQIGFYMAYCNSDWIDTGLRRAKNLCCKDQKALSC
ncbi:hypothetical protein QYM36_016283, partial [Artemia franciscana]